MKTKFLTLILFSLGLIACGSGSGGSNTTLENPDDQARGAADPYLADIVGVYNVSRSDDVAFLHITPNGIVLVFDDQQDASGAGQNCYQLGILTSQINGVLFGGATSYDAATGLYTITNNLVSGGEYSLTFAYTANKGMHNFKFSDGPLTSGSSTIIAELELDLTGGVNIKVGGDSGKQVASPTGEDLVQSLCL